MSQTHKVKDNLSWFINKSKPFHKSILFVIFLVSAYSILSIYSTVFLRDIINDAIAKDGTSLYKDIIYIVLITIINILLSVLTTYFQENMVINLSEKLRHDLIENLLKKEYYQLTNKHSQNYVSIYSNDTNRIAILMMRYIVVIFNFIIQTICSIYLVSKTMRIFLVFFLFAPLLPLPSFLLYKNQKARELQYRKSDLDKRVFVSNTIADLMIVKTYNKEQSNLKKIDSMAQETITMQNDLLKLDVLKKSIYTSISLFGHALVIIVCAIEIFKGKMSYGTSVMALRLLQQTMAPLFKINPLFSDYYRLSVNFEKVREIEKFSDEKDPLIDMQEINNYYDQEFSHIVFNDVSFSYDDEQGNNKVLSNINLEIHKNEIISIKGVTGSGKSTIFKILMSLYPLNGGEIYLLDKNNTKNNLNASYRSLFAYVPQGNYFVNGTIKELVSFFETDNLDEQKVWDSLEIACAKDFVKDLPNGIDTFLHEKGLGLSEGQLQRIAIARAIYSQRPIILLDEATSALDEETEQELLNNIKNLKNKTIIIVAHKPAALKTCDRIYDIKENAYIA